MIFTQVEPPFDEKVITNMLERAAYAALQHEKADPESELSIVIDGDEKLHQLNLDFLGIDRPTDVLSFPSDEFDPDEQAVYIGDIIISYPQAENQAAAAGHPVMNEIQLLVVHGVLHLLGHDHADPLEKSRMWAAQTEILADLGCQINQLPE